MLAAPIQNPKRSVLRAVLEAAAQFTPVTAALTRIYQTTHPSRFERDLSEWRGDMTTASNDHGERIATLEAAYRPELLLSDDAQAMAGWLVKTSPQGLEDPVEFEAVQAAFPDTTSRDLQDAAAELKMVGLARVSGALGHPVRIIVPTYDLFALFDPVVMDTSPQDDAVALARAALELDSGHVPDLQTKTGWPRRRLNPALALLLTLVDPGRVRKVLQPDYVTLGFILSADERVRFRRLVTEAGRVTDR